MRAVKLCARFAVASNKSQAAPVAAFIAAIDRKSAATACLLAHHRNRVVAQNAVGKSGPSKCRMPRPRPWRSGDHIAAGGNAAPHSYRSRSGRCGTEAITAGSQPLRLRHSPDPNRAAPPQRLDARSAVRDKALRPHFNKRWPPSRPVLPAATTKTATGKRCGPERERPCNNGRKPWAATAVQRRRSIRARNSTRTRLVYPANPPWVGTKIVRWAPMFEKRRPRRFCGGSSWSGAGHTGRAYVLASVCTTRFCQMPAPCSIQDAKRAFQLRILTAQKQIQRAPKWVNGGR